MTLDISFDQLLHDEGSKQYAVIMVRVGAAALLINQWGSIGVAGQIQTLTGTQAHMATMRAKKIRQKKGRGYTERIAKKFPSMEDFLHNAPRYISGNAGIVSRIEDFLGEEKPPAETTFEPQPEPEAVTSEEWGSW